MAKNRVEIEVVVSDHASDGVGKVKNAVTKTNQAIEESSEKTGKKQREEAVQTANAVERAQQRMRTASQRVATVRQTLGVRSEHQVQREIQRTIASYNRLRASGTASSRELAQAAQAMRSQVAKLNAEMGRTTWGQRLGNWGRNLASVGAGVAMGVNQLAKPVKETADYNLSLAYLANTAYSDKDTQGRKAGMQNIHQAIKESVTKYGGSKETAAEALNAMVAQGKVSVESALKLLPTVQKNATATGASTTDIAGLVNAGLSYGIKEEEIQAYLDYANASGKAGGFELKDMAQYAPALFASAKGAGLQGMDGAKEMFKILQQVYNVSGGSAETATNTMGFLSKLNSQDTINRAAQLEVYSPKDGKKHGVDLKKSMEERMRKGANPVEAFLGIVDDVMAKDKTYQKLQQELNNAKGDAEKEVALSRVADYVQGTKVGELVADRQAWLGMYGIRSQKLTGENVEKAYETAMGSTNKDYEFIGSQSAIEFQNAQNTAEMGKIEAFTGLSEVTGDLAQKMADYGAKYPELTSSIMGATEAVKALGAAAMMTAGMNLGLGLFSKGGAAAATSSAAKAGAKSIVGGAVANGAKAVGNGALRMAGGAAGLSVAGLVVAANQKPAFDAITEEKAEKETAQEKKTKEAFYRSAYGGIKPTFQYAPVALGMPKKKGETNWANAATGGYALGQLAYDNQVAGVRFNERGTLSKAQYDARVSRNTERVKQIMGNEPNAQGGVPQELLNFVKNVPNLTALSHYQADFQAFGAQISDGLKKAVESQNFVIQNEIKVDLDGRIVAEQTSQYQYQELKRGI